MSRVSWFISCGLLALSARVERFPQFRGSAETGFAQEVEGGRKFDQPGLSRVAQNAKVPETFTPRWPASERAAASSSSTASARSCCASRSAVRSPGSSVARVWSGSSGVGMNLQPCGRSRCPLANGRRRGGMAEFFQDFLGDVNLAVKFCQNIRVADEHEIAKRRGIADNGHQPRAARRAARSRSRSSSV